LYNCHEYNCHEYYLPDVKQQTRKQINQCILNLTYREGLPLSVVYHLTYRGGLTLSVVYHLTYREGLA
jgi:hypothetical protein